MHIIIIQPKPNPNPNQPKKTMNVIIRDPAKADKFATMFQHMKVFSDHINIMFETERMYIQCMDGAHVSIMELALPTEWFDTYEQTHNENVVVGLSSAMLYKILNSRDKSQQLTIVLDTPTADILSIHFTQITQSAGEPAASSTAKHEFDKRFELPLMSIDSEIMDIPEIECQAELTLRSAHFASIVSQLRMFADTMSIECSEEKIVMASQSNDQGKMFVEISIDDVSGFAIDEGCELNLSFALPYLHNMCLYNKLSEDVELQFSENYPMKVVYHMGKGSHMAFYLAPKIED